MNTRYTIDRQTLRAGLQAIGYDLPLNAEAISILPTFDPLGQVVTLELEFSPDDKLFLTQADHARLANE